MKLPLFRSKNDILSVLGGFLIIIGLFLPWLWRGYNSYQVLNPLTGEQNLFYRLITRISPFFLSVESEGDGVIINWFVSLGTTISGAILLCTALLFPLKYERRIMKKILFSLTIFAFFFFFLNLGSGLWLGLVTHFGLGIQLTSIGIVLMLLSLLLDLFS